MTKNIFKVKLIQATDKQFHKRQRLKVKVKVKVGFYYSAVYAMTGPTRFTISEVAVDWQEPNGAAAQTAAI